MSLWGLTDDANSAPTWLSEANTVAWDMQIANAFFVDEEESQVGSNIAKGLDTPGWNVYQTYTDSNGNTRHRSECIVAAKVPAVSATDEGVFANTVIEDQTVADS